MSDPYAYIPPNEITAPKHAAIRGAATEADLMPLRVSEEAGGLTVAYKETAWRCRALHHAILEHAPPSADRSAAERCCRLARMINNEAITVAQGDLDEGRRLQQLARDQIMLARMQACAAVALQDGS